MKCIINILKLKEDRKSQSLTEFVDHAQELVSVYEKNIERAFSQCGDWRLVNTAVYDSDSKLEYIKGNKGKFVSSI